MIPSGSGRAYFFKIDFTIYFTAYYEGLMYIPIYLLLLFLSFSAPPDLLPFANRLILSGSSILFFYSFNSLLKLNHTNFYYFRDGVGYGST